MSVISAGTTLTTALVQTGDTNGNLVFRTGASGTTALTLGSDQSATFAGAVSFSGGAFAAGSAAAPSITFTGDTNTGIFSPGADTIAFTEGGVESMRLNSSGNLGIGVANPETRLHVSGTGRFSGGTEIIQIFHNNTVGYIETAGNSATPIAFANGGTERMRINADGNVGVGAAGGFGRVDIQRFVSTPYTTLTIGDFTTVSNPVGIYLRNNGTSPSGISTAGSPLAFYLGAGTSEAMRITSAGNVGIGTSSPDAKLDVLGGGLTSSSIALTNNDNATISANYNLVFQADRNNNIGGRSFDWRFGGKGYSDGTLQMALTQAGLFRFNSGYGSVATAYGCRAWVQFNGSGVIAASGNVSSVSKNSTGNYTVNFATSMPDASYSAVATADIGGWNTGATQTGGYGTASIGVQTRNLSMTATDATTSVAVFR